MRNGTTAKSWNSKIDTASCDRGVFNVPISAVCLMTIAVDDNPTIPPITIDAEKEKPNK